VREAAPGARNGLDDLFRDDFFKEDNKARFAWRVYMDARGLGENAQPRRAESWDGVEEEALTYVGWVECTYKRREKDASRVEQVTEMALRVPESANMGLAHLLGTLQYQSRADISSDNGLEVVSSKLTMGLGLSAISHGVREGDVLKMTQQVLQWNSKLLESTRTIPLGPKGTPAEELLPFRADENMKVGYTWYIATLDLSVVDLEGEAQPRLRSVKAMCTGKREIRHEGEKVMAFQTQTEDGTARAWYSADGAVLKQSYVFANVLQIMLVRTDETKANWRTPFYQASGARNGRHGAASRSGVR
jgi:hypothetical protein